MFDPDYINESAEYAKAYTNVTGLFQYKDGYYTYNSQENYAEYDKETNQFILYDTIAINNNNIKGQFFPFNSISTVSSETNSVLWGTNDESRSGLNHYLGLTLETEFLQSNNGQVLALNENDEYEYQNMIFEFSGDDDVWIFIDDVLVADLGGNHNPASVKINFATGEIYVNTCYNSDGNLICTEEHTHITDDDEDIVTYEKYLGYTNQYSDHKNAAYKTTIQDMFELANAGDTETWNESTFANGTVHTLKFFYLERGSYASNLSLTYNLQSVSASSINKVDQYGDPVEGATFAVYAAVKAEDESGNVTYQYIVDTKTTTKEENEEDSTETTTTSTVDLSSYTYIENTEKITKSTYTINPESGVITGKDDEGNTFTITPCYGPSTTNKDGEMIFESEDNQAYSLETLKSLFGDYCILREIVVPDGYRLVNDEVWLYFYGEEGNLVLLCDNSYESGVYSSNSLQVTVNNNTLYTTAICGKEEHTHSDSCYDSDGYLICTETEHTHTESCYKTITSDSWSNGKLVAVMLKYTGDNEEVSLDSEDWSIVYGNSEDGFTVVDWKEEYDSLADVVLALYNENNNIFSVFELDENGKYSANISDLVGDIRYYYFMSDNENKSDTKYTVAYYYIDDDEIYQIDAETTSFSKEFSATINVPNLMNCFYAQKFNEDGELVNGAVFALYEVEEVPTTESTSKIYYIASDDDKTKIYLYPDDGSSDDIDEDGNTIAGNNKGKAVLLGGTTNGTYSIDSDTGDITVTISGITYTITSVQVRQTVAVGENCSLDDGTTVTNTSKEDGTAVFANMTSGCYYLREIKTPDDSKYLLNTTEVMIYITEETMLANAGTATDGVTVGRGAGYLVSSMARFASEGDIDETLTWIYGMLKITDESTTFADAEKFFQSLSAYNYITMNYANVYNTMTTNNSSVSIKNYLKYALDSENTIFNYDVNTDRAEESKDAAKKRDNQSYARRLYTEIGWSYLELYQDYEYGKANKNSGANYTDLSETDISNLFSRSLYIQIVDDYRTVSLSISKTVESEESTTAAATETTTTSDSSGETTTTTAETFKFQVEITPHGTAVNYAIYEATTTTTVGNSDSSDESTTTTTTETSTTSQTPKASGTITISSATDTDGSTIYSATINGDQTGYIENLKVEAATEVVTDENGSTQTDGSGNPQTQTQTNVNGEPLYTLTFTLTLKDGEIFQIDGLEPDSNYSIKEINHSGYTASYSLHYKDSVYGDTITDGNYLYDEDEYNIISTKVLHYGLTTVDFVNSVNQYFLPNTGGEGTMKFIISGILLMAMAITGGMIQRKIRNSE